MPTAERLRLATHLRHRIDEDGHRRRALSTAGLRRHGLHDFWGRVAGSVDLLASGGNYRFSLDVELWPRRFVQAATGDGVLFTQANAGLVACRLFLRGPVRPHLCAETRAGGVYVRGWGLERIDRWLKFAGSIGLEAGVAIAAHPSLSVELTAGLRVPLPRRAFYYVDEHGSRVGLLSPGQVAPIAGLGLSWH